MAHPDIAFPSSRRRRGLRGLPAFLALLGILALFPLGLYVLAPWNYYTGGHFHVLPWWDGAGRFSAPASGGDYSMFFTISPSLSQYRNWDLQGTAFLCTPRGERIAFEMGGDLPRGIHKDLNGVPIRMRLITIRTVTALNGKMDPYLDLDGTFDRSRLIIHDNGAINRAFHPDGSLRSDAEVGAPNEKLTFVLEEQPLSATMAPCRARR